MAATVTANISTIIKVSEDSGNTFPPVVVTPSFAPVDSAYLSGVVISTIDLAYMSRATIASGSPLSLDLSGGGLKDPIGNTFSPAKVATLGFYNRGATNVTLTGNFLTSNFGASFSMVLKPGGRFVFDDPSLAGLTVTNTSSDVITLTSASGSNDVDIVVTGRSV